MIRFIFFSVFVINLFYNQDAIAQQETVILYAANEHVIINDTVSVQIKVNGFSDVISFQSSINWDPTVLKYVGVSAFGIKDLKESNFGITQASQGHARFLWTPGDATALSVEDGTTLFSAQFKAIAQIPQETTIGFVDVTSNSPYPTEFANSNYEILNVTTVNGNILVINELKDLVDINSTPDKSCDEKAPNGKLKADVNGDSLTYSFHWYNGNSITSAPDYIGYSYTDIPAGEYVLQIFDGNNALFVESMEALVLDESLQVRDVISVISTTPQTSCSESIESQTGAVEINVNDDQAIGQYHITWWKENYEYGQVLTEYQDSYSAEKIFAGDYEVAVENTINGCNSYLKIAVIDKKLTLQASLSSIDNNFCANGANGSASITIANSSELNPRYYWFYESDEIDTANARFNGPNYDNISHGTYKAWVIDLNSACYTSATTIVKQNPIYSEAIVTQQNDTLFANNDEADWYLNGAIILSSSPYLVPGKSGGYSIAITNDYGCISNSEIFYFGITGLDEWNDQITLSPNPFNEFLSLSNEDGLIEFVKVFDIQGTLINENYNTKDKIIKIYLSNSPAGIYLIKMRKEGKMITRKVIKNLSK
jgi:hypothetical protein